MSIDEQIRAIVQEELDRRGVRASAQEQELLLTVPEAARRTSISAEILRRWIGDGTLPRRAKNPHAKRTVFLVAPDEVLAAAAGKKAENTPESPVSLSVARMLRGAR